jgi:hypothetical protein
MEQTVLVGKHSVHFLRTCCCETASLPTRAKVRANIPLIEPFTIRWLSRLTRPAIARKIRIALDGCTGLGAAGMSFFRYEEIDR